MLFSCDFVSFFIFLLRYFFFFFVPLHSFCFPFLYHSSNSKWNRFISAVKMQTYMFLFPAPVPVPLPFRNDCFTFYCLLLQCTLYIHSDVILPRQNIYSMHRSSRPPLSQMLNGKYWQWNRFCTYFPENISKEFVVLNRLTHFKLCIAFNCVPLCKRLIKTGLPPWQGGGSM